MFQKLSRIIGFTETELKVLLFLISVLLIGYFYKEYFKVPDKSEYIEYDYSKEDSAFSYYSNLTPEENESTLPTETEDTLSNKIIDIKREVLELSEPKFKKESKLSSLIEKSININTATKDEFTKLPGVGEKTAENIITLRNKRGKFTQLEDLLAVKGIGESRFNKIKKFLYIE